MADLVTICGALLTLLGFTVLFLFIRRLGILEIEAALLNDQFHVSKKDPQPMVEVKNPFEIIVSGDKSLLGCIKFVLRCSTMYNFSTYWKLEKDILEKKVFGNASENNTDNSVSLHEILENNSKVVLNNEVVQDCPERTVIHNIRDILEKPLEKGSCFIANKNVFDVVLLMQLTEQDKREIQRNPCAICAMMVGVHLRKDGEHLRPNVVEQYIQSMNGKLFKMKKLFVEAPDTPSSEEREDLGQNLCIVCQMMPISRALIPCGHACLCVMCFDKMNMCPMCRQVITSSFILREEPDLHGNDRDNFSERLKDMNPLEIIRGIFNST